MGQFQQVTHVIFDLDGVLLDTEKLFLLVGQTIAEEFDKRYTPDIKGKLMGKTAYETAKEIISELDLPITTEEYMSKASELCQIVMPTAQLMPGARKLVNHLHNNGIPIGIASNSSKFSFNLKTSQHQELFSLFENVVLAPNDPEVTHGKPAPDVYLVCASRFKDKPSSEKVLVFEDSTPGVEAAVAAGMQVVMIPDPLYNQQAEATMILTSMKDFQPELFGLPHY